MIATSSVLNSSPVLSSSRFILFILSGAGGADGSGLQSSGSSYRTDFMRVRVEICHRWRGLLTINRLVMEYYETLSC